MVMMNLKEIDDEKKDLGPLPLGRYAAKLMVEMYARDKDGRLIMGRNDQPMKLTTQDGHEKWALFWVILNPEHSGRKIFDSLSFSARGSARAKLMLKAAGACDGDEINFDARPEHLHNTYWYIQPHHEKSTAAGGVTPVAKQEFDPRGCSCAVCKDNAGKNVYVKTRVGWNAFERMPDEDINNFPPF